MLRIGDTDTHHNLGVQSPHVQILNLEPHEFDVLIHLLQFKKHPYIPFLPSAHLETVTPGNNHLQVAFFFFPQWKRFKKISNKSHNSPVDMINFTAGSETYWFQRTGKYWSSLNVHCIVPFKSIVLCKAKKEKNRLSYTFNAEWNNHSEPFYNKMKYYFFPHCKILAKAQEFFYQMEKKKKKFKIQSVNLEESWATWGNGQTSMFSCVMKVNNMVTGLPFNYWQPDLSQLPLNSKSALGSEWSSDEDFQNYMMVPDL